MHEFLAKLEAVGSKRTTRLWYKNHLTKFTAQKLKDFQEICVCPGTGRIHHLYRRLIRESSLKDRISMRYFMEIA